MTTELRDALSLHSDMFKDVNGFRPRHYWSPSVTVEAVNAEIERLQVKIEKMLVEERKREDALVELFKARINRVIGLGAGNLETALRWLLDSEHEPIESIMDIESAVWGYGILFTDYGRTILRLAVVMYFGEEAYRRYKGV